MESLFKILLISATVFGAIYVSHYFRYRMRALHYELKAEKEVAVDLRKDLEEIRSRLSALERIVTTKGYQLQDEIERL